MTGQDTTTATRAIFRPYLPRLATEWEHTAGTAAARVIDGSLLGLDITGFTALVDPGAGGRKLEALVGVTVASDTDSDDFSAAASKLEPVLEILHLSGTPDYQLRVACHDTAELDVLLRTLRRQCGAADTETTLILRSGPPLVH